MSLSDAAGGGAASGAAGVVMLLLIVVVVVGLYWLPSIVAFGRRARSRWPVAVVNTFLGWTLIGWVVALAMACGQAEPRPGQGQPWSPPPGPWQELPPPGPVQRW